MTDIIILTEDTSKVAVGQENRSRPLRSNQGRFFAEMGKSAGDRQFRSGITVSQFSLLAVSPTFPGTEPAFIEKFHQEPNPPQEFAFLMETDVRWSKSHFCILFALGGIKSTISHCAPM
jgi:hypothetical protein